MHQHIWCWCRDVAPVWIIRALFSAELLDIEQPFVQLFLLRIYKMDRVTSTWPLANIHRLASFLNKAKLAICIRYCTNHISQSSALSTSTYNDDGPSGKCGQFHFRFLDRYRWSKTDIWRERWSLIKPRAVLYIDEFLTRAVDVVCANVLIRK